MTVSASNRHTRRSLLPFLGDALNWPTDPATTKDVSSTKKRVTATDCNTTQTARNSSPYHLCFKHHQICHSGEQATHQHSDGCSRKDIPGHHHTLQHHKLTVQQSELPADHTSHLLHPSNP